MATKIIIKNSNVPGREPDPGALETGELAINLADQKLYSKDASDTVFELGAETAVDLDYTAGVTDGIVVNSAGDDATIPLADTVNAGLFSATEKDKLANIEDGAQVNVPGDVPSGGTGDRPTTPSIGSLFYDVDLGALLYWDGTAWVEVGSGSGSSEVIVSDSAPATNGLTEGTLWWNSDASDLNLYILYQDADPDGGLKWVQACAVGGGSSSDAVLLDDGGTRQTITSQGLAFNNGGTDVCVIDDSGNITQGTGDNIIQLQPAGISRFSNRFDVGSDSAPTGGTSVYMVAEGNESWNAAFNVRNKGTGPIMIGRDQVGAEVYIINNDGTQSYKIPGTETYMNAHEELMKTRETFRELQIAVQNATDFSGLKAAMLVALEDHNPDY